MIHNIKEWFKAAKPNPSTADVCVQIGCHYEKVAEMNAVLNYDVEYMLEATALDYERYYSRYLDAAKRARERATLRKDKNDT